MQPSYTFVRQLRAFDPWLRVAWLGVRERWAIVMLNGAPTRDNDVPAPLIQFIPVGELDGRPLFKGEPMGSVVQILEREDGGFLPLGPWIINSLRSADTWKKDPGYLHREREAGAAKIKAAKNQEINAEYRDTNRTIVNLNRPFMDFGGKYHGRNPERELGIGT